MSDAFRDEELGDALRQLEVPEHRAGFFSDLSARLEVEAPALGGHSSTRWSNPRTLTALAASVLALAVAVSVLSRTTAEKSTVEPQFVTASAVRARVGTALGSLTTLTGEITVTCAIDVGSCSPPETGGRSTKRWSFAATAAGDERTTGIGFTDDAAFSVADRVQRELVDFGNGLEGVEIRNPGAGPPDAFTRSPLRRNFASVVRAFLSDRSDTAVTEVSENGREAWLLAMAVTPNKLAGPERSGDQLEIVVDQETGFPLRITESLNRRFLHEIRLTTLVADAPLPASTFTISFPAGAPVFRQDAEFRPVSPSEAARVVGYAPLVATTLPKGFELAEMLAAADGPATGNEAANPAASGVVSMAFRRGFDRIIVTSRLRGGAARCAGDGTGETTCWADPVASGEGNSDEAKSLTISRGALRGSFAELVVSPRGVPHVWSIDERLVVTVSGDASAEELVGLVESLQPAPVGP